LAPRSARTRATSTSPSARRRAASTTR
jgi:hypothetical protein